MKRYRISREALADIDQIITYIARDSRRNAVRVWERFEETFERLAESPGIGHERAELRDPTLRVCSVYSYLVIYDPTVRPVLILRVVHGARNINRLKVNRDAN
jgi:antitoxin ParD1/3/4/toxin ParE1/3/4